MFKKQSTTKWERRTKLSVDFREIFNKAYMHVSIQAHISIQTNEVYLDELLLVTRWTQVCRPFRGFMFLSQLRHFDVLQEERIREERTTRKWTEKAIPAGGGQERTLMPLIKYTNKNRSSFGGCSRPWLDRGQLWTSGDTLDDQESRRSKKRLGSRVIVAHGSWRSVARWIMGVIVDYGLSKKFKH